MRLVGRYFTRHTQCANIRLFNPSFIEPEDHDSEYMRNDDPLWPMFGPESLQDSSSRGPFVWELHKTILYEHMRLALHSTPSTSLSSSPAHHGRTTKANGSDIKTHTFFLVWGHSWVQRYLKAPQYPSQGIQRGSEGARTHQPTAFCVSWFKM